LGKALSKEDFWAILVSGGTVQAENQQMGFQAALEFVKSFTKI